MNWTAFVIPAFFVFLGLEYWIAKISKKQNLFSYENSISNLSIGIGERVLNLLIVGSFYSLYDWIYVNYHFLNIPTDWWVWVLLLLATDFVWYWYHRLGHEINLLWGAHIVHHQSEDFNYTVSARITTLQAVVRNLFWCLLPLIGFQPSMVIFILVVHGAYSFFTHTQIVGKLGWLEYILITPSHHGVHHASNEKYLNKNYGDIFVFWDVLFGTFQREEEQPVFGLTHPLKSHSFLWQHFHYYAELIEAFKRSKSIWGGLKILFGKPENLDQSIRPYLESKLLPSGGTPPTHYRFKLYLTIQIVAVLIIAFLTTLFFNYLDTLTLFLSISIIVLTLINCGALLEQQRWIYYLELVRMILICGWVSQEAGSTEILLASLLVLILLSSFDSTERWYFRFVYGRENQYR